MNSSNTHLRRLGNNGPAVFSIGLGCMGMSDVYGKADDAESIATIHAALDAGVNLIDTGDFYGSGLNEMLIGRALKDRREQALLSVKFGALRDPRGGWVGYDARPAAIKNFVTYSLRRLGVDHLDIYRPARLDPNVPIEETVGAIADLIKAGYVRYLGLSEVGVDTIKRAHAVYPVTDVQLEYSLVSRNAESQIFPLLRNFRIGVTGYGVLSRGLLSGSMPTGAADFRSFLPRFKGENLTNNQQLVARLKEFAERKHISAAQLAIAWVLAKDINVIPVLGARTRKQLSETLQALSVQLSTDELSELEAAVPAAEIAGTRYDGKQMLQLDSER